MNHILALKAWFSKGGATRSGFDQSWESKFDQARLRFCFNAEVRILIKTGSGLGSSLGSEFESKMDPDWDPAWGQNFDQNLIRCGGPICGQG